MSSPWLLWAAPLPPLLVFAVATVTPARLDRSIAHLSIVATALAAVASIGTLAMAVRNPEAVAAIDWLTLGDRRFELGLGAHPLSVLMAVAVAIIALVVIIYAVNDSTDDPRRGHLLGWLMLFVGSMLLLVLAADVVTLFVAWELVGAASYLLIGYRLHEAAGAAASEAFIVTRLGDLALLAALLLLVLDTGTARIDQILAAGSTAGAATAALLLIAAATKSAQVPFQIWLPDAMVGPTPVSALLHSATMVAAGAFLLARFHPLVGVSSGVATAVAWTGVATTLLGGLAALVESDLKRALAYSTMSQLGLMFVALGAGSVTAAMLLLVVHAVYKSLLFLAAGVVEHAVGSTSLDRMGGLARRLRVTFAAVVIGAAALAGLPVSVALPAKDAVVAAAAVDPALLAAVLLASFITALYSARLVIAVFLGPGQAERQEIRTPARGVVGPAVTLAALVPLAALAGATVVGEPIARLLGRPVPDAGAATIAALALAGVGVVAGIIARRRWPSAVVWPAWAGPLLRAEIGLRPLAERVASWSVQGASGIAAFDRGVFEHVAGASAAGAIVLVHGAQAVDRAIFDRAADAVSTWTLTAIRSASRFDRRRVDAFVGWLAASITTFSERARRLQTGRIENYLLPVFVWGLVVVLVALLAGR